VGGQHHAPVTDVNKPNQQRTRNVRLHKVERDINMMAHAQRMDFVFQRKGPVHSNGRGCQLNQAVAGEVCTS
jgi:hypothetical protein